MIVIAGKNDIAVHGLILAIEFYGAENVAVIINKNDTGIDGWQRSLLKAAVEAKVKVLSLDEVYSKQIKLFLSLEFDQIIKPEKLKIENIFNIHFSKLPKYKGMYTSVWPILYGDNETAVTLHKIDSGIDTGDIIAQEVFTLSEKDRSQDCYRKYIKNSKKLLDDNFEKIVNSTFESRKQPSDESTYFSSKTINFHELNIEFNKTAWQVKRQVYAFSFRPYQLLCLDNKKISEVVITKDKSKLKPGTIIDKSENYTLISTIDYDIELHFDDLNGFLKKIPTISLVDFKKNLTRILGINDKNEKGWSPIIVAAYHGRKDIIDFLIENGADINDRNYRGTTVLMYAKDYSIVNDDSTIFRYLMSLGADANLKDWSGKKILDYITNKQAKFLGLL
ncbi:formyltransferase family protein [Acinetobacter chinensis]|uniref:formyltransferase family protein n=1 Tax=Acinetobacter chinensis TaxID=2004650 RepID=UPI002934386D|nr:formyltransferase family protein [Acinetobacter chinensis]WOE41346.1 formyltransferase family protein [Acinetobacter chinensis]